MPRAPLPVDWGAIHAYYIQGITIAKLAKQYGIKPNTITSRATRGKWVLERAESLNKRKEEVIAAVTPPVRRDAESVSTECRNWFERDIRRVMDRLDTLSPDTLNIRELDVRQGVVKGLYGMVSELFDWTGEQSKTPIQSQLLAKLLDEVEGMREKRAKATIDLPPAPEGEGSKVESLAVSPAESPVESAPPSPTEGEGSKGPN